MAFRSRSAFSLVALLVVIAILAILAAFLFPVFARAKAQAKQAQCLSNLNQIGKAMMLYMNDYDDVFPAALDASDRHSPDIWNAFPEFRNRIASMPMMHDALQPYAKSMGIFRCPSDSGTRVLDNHFPVAFPSAPTMHAVFGSSYFFRTEIAFRAMQQTSFKLPADVNVMFDGAGHWHGSKRALEPGDNYDAFLDLTRGYRYNCLFGDMHVKSLHYHQIQNAWDVDL